ncbi:MAG TPA: DUF11 domain-containing protein, partial [Flavisolibacter sp.]|nr:DUF11 domain-containing protein [Flavisolibacter sp.]
MKLSTAFITGLFISISALVFFRQDEKLMHFLQGKQTPPPVTEKTDKDNGRRKKKTTQIPVQGKTVGASTAKKDWQRFFVPAPPITAVKTVDKTDNAVAGDVLNYSVTITNNGLADETNLSFTDNVDPNTTIVSGSLKTSPVAFDDSYSAIGNVGLSVPDVNGVLTNDAPGTNPA